MNRPRPTNVAPEDRLQHGLQHHLQYGQIFAEAFSIFRRHPILWVAGIISALFNGGVGGNFNFNTNIQTQFPTPTQPGELPDFGKMIEGTWIEDVIANPVPYVAVGFALIVLFSIIRLIFGTWAESALYAMVDEADTTGETTLGRGWGRARTRLGSLIGANLLLVLPIILTFGLSFALLGPVYLTLFRAIALPPEEAAQVFEQAGAAMFAPMMIAFPLLCCLGFPVLILSALLRVYALRAVLLEDLGAWAGIKRSWQIVRRQLGYTLLNGVILFVFGAVMGLLISLPAAGVWMRVVSNVFQTGEPFALTSDAIFLGIYLFLSGLLFGGIFTSFSSALWTKLFKAFTTVL